MKKTLLLLLVSFACLASHPSVYAQSTSSFEGLWVGQISPTQSISIKFTSNWQCEVKLNGKPIDSHVVCFKVQQAGADFENAQQGYKIQKVSFLTQDALNGVKCSTNNGQILSEPVNMVYNGTVAFDNNNAKRMLLDVDFRLSPCEFMTSGTTPTQVTFIKQ